MFEWFLAFFFFFQGSPPSKLQAPDACKPQLYQGQSPEVTTTWQQRSHTICYTNYETFESGITRTPLWSAEHLTKDRITSAKSMKRKDLFHADPNISQDDRAELSDYKQSGYDRGHMSPNDDMPDATSQFESFSLANMVPQDRCNNEIIWKAIETAARNYVLNNDDVYIVTGPIFNDTQTTIGQDKVYVPSSLFKAIYDPTQNALIIVVTENKNVTTFTTISQADLLKLTGVTVFPTVTTSTALKLPSIGTITGHCKKDHS